MSGSLAVTLLVEGVIQFVYARWRKKPAGRLLLAGAVANLITQSILWLALNVFVDHYLVALFVAELFIWPAEAACLYFFPGTRLGGREALYLSLGMNAASFGLGWWLPV